MGRQPRIACVVVNKYTKPAIKGLTLLQAVKNSLSEMGSFKYERSRFERSPLGGSLVILTPTRSEIKNEQKKKVPRNPYSLFSCDVIIFQYYKLAILLAF